MSRSISLTITLEDDGTALSGVAADFDVTNREVMTHILGGMLSFTTEQCRAEVAEAEPGLNETFVDTIAALNARLLLLHEVMHLPDATS